jgi:sulfur carrier protein ThiS
VEGFGGAEMKIHVETRDFRKTVAFRGKTVKQLMKALKLNSENFVLSRNGEIVLEDEVLKDGDKVKLFPVISGG